MGGLSERFHLIKADQDFRQGQVQLKDWTMRRHATHAGIKAGRAMAPMIIFAAAVPDTDNNLPVFSISRQLWTLRNSERPDVISSRQSDSLHISASLSSWSITRHWTGTLSA